MGRWKHVINVVILAVAFSTLSVSFGQSYGSERYYEYVIKPRSKLTISSLVNKLPYRLEYLIELNNPVDREPVGDTLAVWFQHVPKTGMFSLPTILLDVDVVITCYPERLPNVIRRKHALKDDTGIVHMLEFRSEDIIIVYAPNNKSEMVKLYEEKFEQITGTHPNDIR